VTAPLPLTFVGSFPDPLHPLEPRLPEIALLGRSNVGKSSLLNALAGRKSLARVSGTPGKTSLLNVYRMPDGYLLDLPGYGYARRSHGERTAFRRLVNGVLEKRETLGGVVWLLDVRHPPSREDLEMQDLLAERERPTLVVLTKADKLSRSEQRRSVRERAGELGVTEAEILLTSTTSRLGIEDLSKAIQRATRAP
jgi:GTP-binding protein